MVVVQTTLRGTQVTDQIEVDSEVMALLKSQAEPFVDTPNSVLRRLLGLAAASPNGHRPTGFTEDDPQKSRKRRGRTHRRKEATKRAQTGTILPDTEYELPILEILDSHGG